MSQTMNPEASRKFGKAVLEAAHATERHVLDGSLKVEFDHSDAMARVSWESVAMVPVEDIKRIMREAQA